MEKGTFDIYENLIYTKSLYTKIGKILNSKIRV